MKKDRYSKELIGKSIQEERKKWLTERGLKESRREFIDKSGIKALHGGKNKESDFQETTLVLWENGYRAPSIEGLIMLCNIFGCDMSRLLGEHPEKHKKTHDLKEELHRTISEEAIENILKSSEEKVKAPELFLSLNPQKKAEETPREVYLVDIIEAIASPENQRFIEFIAETIRTKHLIEDFKKRENYKFFKEAYDMAKTNTSGIVNVDWEKQETGINPLAREGHIKHEYHELIEEYCKNDEENYTGKPWDYCRPIDYSDENNYFRILWAEDSLELEKRYSTIAFMFRDIIKGLE